MRPMLWILSAGVIAGAACKGKDQPAAGAEPARQQGMGGMRMDSMPMGSDRGGMAGSGMMPAVRAHMDSMTRMSPERMSGMMAAHDRLMSQMLDRMGSDMRGMQMNADAKWTALVDSVTADLADLPGLQGKALSARMSAHAGRVGRLVAMHEGMMKGT